MIITNFLIEMNIDIKALPDNFDTKKVVKHEKSQCEICYLKFGISNKRHHCKRCGKSVCSKCSLNQRPLSKKDLKTIYRVCDYCDTDL